MGITATSEGGAREPLPEGQYTGICFSMLDLGTSENTFEGKVKKRRQVFVQWEIPEIMEEFEVDGKTEKASAVIGKFYTLSMDDRATLKQDLEAWRGKSFTAEEKASFDITNVLGAPALIAVTHKTKGDGSLRDQVGSLMALPKGMPAPVATRDQRLFSFEDGGDLPEGLSDGLVAMIQKSDQWQAAHPGEGAVHAAAEAMGASVVDANDENLPF